MSQSQAAFIIQKSYTGPKQVEGYVRKQSRKPNTLNKTIFLKLDLISKLIICAPSKLDSAMSEKKITFEEIFQIYSETLENVDLWANSITIEFKSQMKKAFKFLFETEQLFQVFLSALSAVHDQNRNTPIYFGKKVMKGRESQISSRQDTNTINMNRKMAIQSRLDIYKKRNQSVSSQSRTKQHMIDNDTCQQQLQDNEKTVEINRVNDDGKNPQKVILHSYQNNYFGRCINRNVKTVCLQKSSRGDNQNQHESNQNQTFDQSLKEETSKTKNYDTQLTSARQNFRKTSYISQNIQNEKNNELNNGQYYSTTVPQSNNRSQRPSIVIERDDIHLNEGNSNNLNTPFSSANSTITPRHSSISARSRKYKIQKNISFDTTNPSRTHNFYAENHTQKQKRDDDLIQKLNKTTITCNYYEPNVEPKKNETKINFSKQYPPKESNETDIQQKQNNENQQQQQFYPQFAKRSQKSSHTRAATAVENDLSDWSLVSIKSPKIKSSIDQSQQENASDVNLMKSGKKKINIVNQRSNKLSNKMQSQEYNSTYLKVEDEQNIQKQQDYQDKNKNNNGKNNISHLLSNTKNFKRKSDSFQEQSYEDDILRDTCIQQCLVETSRFGQQMTHQEQANQGTCKVDDESDQYMVQSKHIQRLDSLSIHKASITQTQYNNNNNSNKIQQIQDNVSFSQPSILLRPSNSQNNQHSFVSTEKQSKQENNQQIGQPKSEKQAFQQINLISSNSASTEKEVKKEYNSYLKQMYDFNQNKLMNDDIHDNSDNYDDAYKLILNDNQSDNNIANKIKIEIKPNNGGTFITKSNLQQILSKNNQNQKLNNESKQLQQEVSQPNNQQNGNLFDCDNHKQMQKASKSPQKQDYIQSPTLKNKINNKQNLQQINIIENQDLTIKQNHCPTPQPVFNTQTAQCTQASKDHLSVIEFHEFDNSFDNESFSQIKKVDEIIKIIEEQSQIVLQKNKKLENASISTTQNQNSQKNQQHEQQQNQQQQNIQKTQKTETIDNNLRSGSDQEERDDEFCQIDNRNENQIPSKSVNYDWNSLQNTNTKPTTSPLKERLFIQDDDENEEEDQQLQQKVSNLKQNDQLMIVTVNKNERKQYKQNEQPILRQRDVFSDEFWNPVTQPKNYKVTNQPPNLKEGKKQRQTIVPVKVENTDQLMLADATNTTQKESISSQIDKSDAKQQQQKQPSKKEKETQNIQSSKQASQKYNTHETNEQKSTSIFDEVKDFFNKKGNNNNYDQKILNDALNQQSKQAQQNENNEKIQKFKQIENSNNYYNKNERKFENNYDDWDEDL